MASSRARFADCVPRRSALYAKVSFYSSCGCPMSLPGDQAPFARDTQTHLPVPVERIGRYQLLEKVGGGGMGIVYKARHLALQRTVAVKLLHPNKEHLEHLAARFWREMEAAGKLDDPHVVRATDAGQEGDTLFLAIEF